ncbi:MAG TPA: glycosyltransferase [Thermoplasmata archaeon]|nr:glycosyltransferase [Thermoplasmata archaeon]
MGSDASPRPLISVVVTVRNEAPHLPRLLDNLVVQEPPLEVVVVESESRDRTRAIADEYARRYPDLIRVFSRPGSRGIGRNIGVAEARGDLIAFIDGDCFPDSQWLHALRASAGAAAVLAGRTVTVGRAQYGHLERVELFQSGYDVTYPSCNLLYRRALFERLGGFDPRFITAEDIDLNLRAVRSGAAIRYVPEAVVYHQVRTTLVRFLYQAFWNGYGRKQLTEKHGSLWGRYRVRRLLEGQRSAVAWARLAAALIGYGTRVLTAGPKRLTPENGAPTRSVSSGAEPRV